MAKFKTEEWTINEEQANKILETNPITTTESDIFNDLFLTEEERIKHTAKILEIRRIINECR